MDGIIIVDKAKGFTSHDVVNIARKALKTKRIGHIGTLDPNATGVLVLCVDRATKLVKYFENHSKTYLADIQLGLQTDTDDLTGKIIKEASTEGLELAQVKQALNEFIGPLKQLPPNYSAIKVNGKKLYELARRDLTIPDLKPRDITVHSIEDVKLISQEPFCFQAKIRVSKGTYIRAIARDLGEKLGVYGSLKDLQRTAIDKFNIAEAISIETLRSGDFELLDPFKYLNLKKYVIDPKLEHYVRHGRFLESDLVPYKEDIVIYNQDNQPLAIYYFDENKNQMRMSVKWC